MPLIYRFHGKQCPLRSPIHRAADKNAPGLIGQKVTHKSFGEGIITRIADTTLYVQFKEKTARFQSSDAIGKWLTLVDSRKEAAETTKYIEQKVLQKTHTIHIQKSPSNQVCKKPTSRHNAAFKLNYCNGGKTVARFGFDGVCSEAVIRYNIEKEHRVWCSNERCDCRRFFDGKISYQTLLKTRKGNDFPCYESIALRDWKAHAGASAKGDPRTIRGAVVNKLGVFTTVPPNEKERFIFGAFMMQRISEGDSDHIGVVLGNREYCLELTPKEARKVRFWDYYKNPNHPENHQWGSGLVRYFDDDTAVRILKAMLDAKENKAGKLQAKQLLSRYCEANNIAIE